MINKMIWREGVWLKGLLKFIKILNYRLKKLFKGGCLKLNLSGKRRK